MLNESDMAQSDVEVALQSERYDELIRHPHAKQILKILSNDYVRERHHDNEVLLFSHERLAEMANSGKVQALVYNEEFTLRADIEKALEPYKVYERRVIWRVLVMGQSLRFATKCNRSRSAKSWDRWFYGNALPALRVALREYSRNGKVVA